jgi:phosphatidylserine/phosphatidylglycerophosphate/cardiolipin synthase-like enzyme
MKRAVIGLLYALTYASAQSPQPLPDTSAVVEVIRAATSEVLIASDTLQSQEVADALRAALVTRGVAVYLLIPAQNAAAPASYAASLAHAGAQVRLVEVGGGFLIVDRRFVVAGPLIGSSAQVGVASLTFLVDDPMYTAPFVEGFRLSFGAAAPYVPPGR